VQWHKPAWLRAWRREQVRKQVIVIRLSTQLDLSVSLSSKLMLLHSTYGYQAYWAYLWKPPLPFWRRPPQSNYPPNNVSRFAGLDTRYIKGGISTSAPRWLAPPLQSVPPMLHIMHLVSMLSYSEGSWGLSVPLRVTGVFTDTTISPSSWLRQRPDRYTIRAGRNLPDKEFRYLRTVIVTAAVYRGFNSDLRVTPKPPS